MAKEQDLKLEGQEGEEEQSGGGKKKLIIIIAIATNHLPFLPLLLPELASTVLDCPSVSIGRRIDLELPFRSGFSFGAEFLFERVPRHIHADAVTTITRTYESIWF